MTAYDIAYDKYIELHTEPGLGYQLIFMNVSGMPLWESEENFYNTLRTDEKGITSCDSADGYSFMAIYD